jgi:hypothetical protein
MNVWHFASTGEAYDATQTDERIKDGDVLVVASEEVVGFLLQAWPVAVTEARGHFHDGGGDANLRSLEGGKYTASVDAAWKAYHDFVAEPLDTDPPEYRVPEWSGFDSPELDDNS